MWSENLNPRMVNLVLTIFHKYFLLSICLANHPYIHNPEDQVGSVSAAVAGDVMWQLTQTWKVQDHLPHMLGSGAGSRLGTCH